MAGAPAGQVCSNIKMKIGMRSAAWAHVCQTSVKLFGRRTSICRHIEKGISGDLPSWLFGQIDRRINGGVFSATRPYK